MFVCFYPFPKYVFFRADPKWDKVRCGVTFPSKSEKTTLNTLDEDQVGKRPQSFEGNDNRNEGTSSKKIYISSLVQDWACLKEFNCNVVCPL